MRPVLLAPGLALAALVADAGSAHDLAGWLILLALPAAAAASFVAVSDALAGEASRLRATTASLALVLLVVGSTVREGAPRGAAVPVLALSTIVMALACYAVPGFAWLLTEPLRSLRTAGPRPRAARS